MTKKLFFLSLFLVLIQPFSYCQKAPSKHLSVSVLQNINFGAFSQGSAAGSVVLMPDGTRSATGGVILVTMGYSYYPAIFEVSANPNTVIDIINGPDATLTSNNGGAMILHIFRPEPNRYHFLR
ncbi:MAG: DUF4402 domain-containing protein [Bacteroidetes bacterium]|nr:DUF4402 domain-containing protein [Bacteroidota bacterium]